MNKLVAILVCLAGAFAAWGLWIAEILWFKGWAGLAWLAGFNWSSIPICIILVLMTSYFASPVATLSRRLIFMVAGSLLAISSFLLVRQASFELFSGGFPGRAGLGWAMLIAGWLILPIGLTLSASRWLGPIHLWASLLIAAALAISIPLSFATIKLFPAINGSTDQIHAFKMGYPVIWIIALVPTAMRLAQQTSGRPHRDRQVPQV